MNNSFHGFTGLPPDVLGFLEWSSGVLWINMDSDAYLSWFDSKDRKKNYIDEAIYHELFHGLQVATAGYLNYYSSLFLKEILVDHKEQLSLVNRPSNQFSDWFAHLYKETPPINNKAQTILDRLDLASDCGVTTREIIEGPAYLWQKTITDPDITYLDFKNKLCFSPSKDYSNAFQYTEGVLGINAFTHFHSICFMALCFLEPHIVFPKLCAQLEFADDSRSSNIYEISQILAKEHHYLGDVITCFEHIDFESSGYDWINPLHQETIKKVIESSESAGLSIAEMMSDPMTWFSDMSSYMHRPMIFKNGDVILYGSDDIVKYSGKESGDIYGFIPQLHIGIYCFILYVRTGKGPKLLKMKHGI